MKRKSKNIILIALIILIFGIAIGYAALAQILNINGIAQITAQWNVKINSITEGTMIGATSENAPIVSGDSLTASFNVNLQYPGASATYIIQVANMGTVDAKLDSITGIDVANANQPIDVTYSIDAVPNDTLNSNSTKNYIVTVSWDPLATSIPATTTKTATIRLNYVQAL